MVQMRIRRDGEWVAIPYAATSPYRGLAWHHTDPRGLIGIVEQRELWASSPLTLNDSSELTYGMNVLRKTWERLQESQDIRSVDSSVKTRLTRLLSTTQPLAKWPVYFLCATKRRDALNQWQQYSRAQGFALGIDITSPLAPVGPETLVVPSKAHEMHELGALGGWYDVIYDEEEQEVAAETLLRFAVVDLAPAPQTSLVPSVVGLLLARMKPKGFEAEDEIRYIRLRTPDTTEYFRPGYRGVVPYLRLRRNPKQWLEAIGEDEPRQSIDIRTVVSAPAGEEEQFFVGQTVRRLLDANELEAATVGASKIPYRF